MDFVKSEFGWNIKHNRPALAWEQWDNIEKHNVCLCSACALPHTCQYSVYHCSRKPQYVHNEKPSDGLYPLGYTPALFDFED